MKNFIGTKEIKATQMTRLEYTIYRGWELPADEDGDDEGYLVEYLDGGTPNHPDHVGYISWSPKEQFDNAYQDITEGMSFGHAIELLKAGNKVARKGWNEKDMFLFYIDGYQWDFVTDVSGVDDVETMPFICMKTADNKLVPWLAIQTDMLIKDWVVIQ